MLLIHIFWFCLPFGLRFRWILIPFWLRWQSLVLAVGIAYFVATLNDAFALDPWLFSLRNADSQFWPSIFSGRLFPLPLPLSAEIPTIWQALMNWNLSSSLGLISTGLLHLILLFWVPPIDPSLHQVLILIACVSIWCYTLAAFLYFGYLPALILFIAGVGAFSDLRVSPTGSKQTKAKEIRHYNNPNISSMSATIGSLPLLLTGFIHLFAALTRPHTFAPIDGQLSRRLTETFLAMPLYWGSETTFWQVYMGSSIAYGLSICTLSLTTISLNSARILKRYSPILSCLKATGVLYLVISFIYPLWVPPIVIVTYLIGLLI